MTPLRVQFIFPLAACAVAFSLHPFVVASINNSFSVIRHETNDGVPLTVISLSEPISFSFFFFSSFSSFLFLARSVTTSSLNYGVHKSALSIGKSRATVICVGARQAVLDRQGKTGIKLDHRRSDKGTSPMRGLERTWLALTSRHLAFISAKDGQAQIVAVGAARPCETHPNRAFSNIPAAKGLIT